MEEAIFAEEQNKVELAAQLYEKCIENDPCPPIDCFINLILIYFVANDPGDMHKYGLNLDFASFGYKRMEQLFKIAKKCYPNSMELLFWENYVHFILYFSENFPDIVKNFSKQNETLIPFFYFYNSENQSYSKEAKQLYEQVKQGRTCKERYIKSILEGDF